MKNDYTLPEMLAGILLMGVILQIVLLIFGENHGYNAIGLWCGILVAVIWTVHMKRSIEDALDLDIERAENHARKGYAVRMVIAGVLIGMTLYLDLGNPLTILMGVTALKLTAYLQPLMHKVFLKILKNGGKRRGK